MSPSTPMPSQSALRHWDELPIDIVTKIATHLPRLADKARMSATCRTWRNGVRQQHRRPRLPDLTWLFSMATPLWVIARRGAPDTAEAAAGEEAQRAAVSVAASSSSLSRSLPPAAAPPPSLSPPLAAGSHAQHAAVPDAAPSPSRLLPPAAAPPSSRSPPLAVGSQAQHGVVSNAASSSSRFLPPAIAPPSSLSPPLTAGIQVPHAAESDDAPSYSRSLPPAAAPSSTALARSLDAGRQEMTWVILGRVLVAEDEDDEDAGAEAHAHAQDAAADFNFSLAPPPQVTFVSAGRSAHPDPSNPDECPYIISAAQNRLLAHFAKPPGTSHLAMLHNFHTEQGQTTATAERVIDRPCYAPTMMNIGSIVLYSDDSEYSVCELQVHRGDSSARLVFIRSGHDWDWKDIRCPLPAGDRQWVPHGAVSTDKMLFWFDLSWGMLSYDASVTAKDPKLLFHLLPDDRDLDEATPGIHTHRCITVSRNQLRYIDIIPEGGSARITMWSWSCVSGAWQWQRTYSMSFGQIWDDDSYKNTVLGRHVPVLAVVCPSDPELVYFSLQHQLFGINVPSHTVVQSEVFQLPNMSWPPPTASSRHLIAWVLPPGVGKELKPMEPHFPLSVELVGVIANFLECPVARLFLSMVCREWRAEILLLKPLPQCLPGLLLPYHNFKTLSINETRTEATGSLICLTCCTIHPFRLPADLHRARFIGSYEGGWVFVAYGQDRYNALVNMHSGEEPILLPDEIKLFGWLRQHIILRAATLSAPPEFYGCIGAAIVSTSLSGKPNEHVVLWRMGSRVISCQKQVAAADILYMDGSFYVLLKNGDITVCTPELDDYLSLNQLEVEMKDLHFQTIDDELYLPYSRYLVEWEGNLLMVVRRRRPAGAISSLMTPTPSCSFQVFQMTKQEKQAYDQLHSNEYLWERLTLDGLIILLGHGCSKCYNAASFPGVQSGVYFHDELFNESDTIWNEMTREYPYSDIGVCWELPDRVETLLTELNPSEYSSAIWFMY